MERERFPNRLSGQMFSLAKSYEHGERAVMESRRREAASSAASGSSSTSKNLKLAQEISESTETKK